MPVLSSFARFAGIASTGLMLALASPAFAQSADTQATAPENGQTQEGRKDKLLGLLADDHVLGNPDASVIVIEYASLSCPHCAHSHGETFPRLKEKYMDTGKIAYVYRNFPFNDPALRGAMLSECAGDAQFYKYISVLMKSQDKWAFTSDYMGALRSIARIGGMSEEAFDACMKDEKIQNRVVAGMTWAANELGVNSTPTTFVNGEKLPGFQSIEALSKIIDPLLEKGAPKAAQ